MTLGAYVAGLGLWTPGASNAQAWLSGEHNPEVVEPDAAVLPARLVRRTSLVTRMIVEVFSQAARGIDWAQLPTVIGTTYGEYETLLALLRQLWTEEALSPTRFHNSVYNTAGGYLSISTSNRQFTTTIAAGADTVPMALLEALALVADGADQVVTVMADEAPPTPFLPGPGTSLAVAFLLTRTRGPECLGRLENFRPGQPGEATSIPERFERNPAAAALPLLAALQRREPVTVSAGTGWVVDVRP